MMRVIVAVALLATAGFAFTDFSSMSHPHTRKALGNGWVQLEHEFNHQFTEHGTYFKVKYHAHHEDKWHFVELHNHVGDFDTEVICGEGEHELYVLNPSRTLVEQLAKQSLTHTVLTAHARHHCAEKHIFRQVTDMTYYEDEDLLHLETASMSYNQIFKNLKMSLHTDHVESRTKDVEAVFPTDSEKFAGLEMGPAVQANTTKRGMDEQWFHFHPHISHIWHAAKDDVASAAKRCVKSVSHVVSDVAKKAAPVVKKVVHDVAPVVKKVGKVVGKVAKVAGKVCKDIDTVAKILSGNYQNDKVWTLKGINYNGDVSKTYNKDQLVTVHAGAGASFDLTPSIHFELDISDWHVETVEAYFEGTLNAGINGKFGVTISKTLQKKGQVADIKMSPIHFMIGPVPIVIKSGIPINAGYRLDIDGRIAVQGVIKATGMAKYGYQYTKANGHSPIKTHSFTYTHDFLPVDYSIEIGLEVFVQPILNIQIDSVLNAAVAVRVQGNIMLESNPTCIAYVSISAQPTVGVKAGIDLDIHGHNLLNYNYGPHTVYSHLFPIYSYCKPFPKKYAKDFSAGAHKMIAQADRASGDRNYSLNSGPIIVSTTDSMSSRFVGTTWSVQGLGCGANSNVREDISVMFTTGPTPTSSILLLTVASTLRMADNAFASKLVQAVYMMDSLLASTTSAATLTLLEDDGNYYHTSNETQFPVSIAQTIQVSAVSATMASIVLNTNMICSGAANLTTPQMNNDNSTFTIFASGGARAVGGDPYGAAEDSNNEDIPTSSVLYYIIAVGAVAVVAAIVAIVMAMRKTPRQEARAQLREVNRKEAALPMIEEGATALNMDETQDVKLNA